MLRSTEEGEYPNITPYPATSDETQPLLSQQRATRVSNDISHKLKAVCAKIGEYVNPPMLGGGLAMILGMIPFMRHALFDNTGLLSPVADSIKNLGKLYTVLQTWVLGARLYSKQGGRPAFWPMFYLFMIRFVVMTVLSCAAVYGIRRLLGDVVKEDPMLVRRETLWIARLLL
jgi:predicted permease